MFLSNDNSPIQILQLLKLQYQGVIEVIPKILLVFLSTSYTLYNSLMPSIFNSLLEAFLFSKLFMLLASLLCTLNYKSISINKGLLICVCIKDFRLCVLLVLTNFNYKFDNVVVFSAFVYH